MIVFHGSQKIIDKPEFGVGKPYNDFGKGFYCTEHEELAKEWACPVKNNGFANKYSLELSGLKVLDLTSGNFNILNWLALLLKNRTFDLTSNISINAKEYILSRFLPNINNIDVIIGYRADDSYFSFADDFINNIISIKDLDYAMRLGTLGKQIVLVSEKSFAEIKFIESSEADYHEYYFKRINRDNIARDEYSARKKNLIQTQDDIFIIDIIRGKMTNEELFLS